MYLDTLVADEGRTLVTASEALAFGAQPHKVAAYLEAWAEQYPDLIGSAGPVPAVPIPPCCLDCGGPVEPDATPSGATTLHLNGVLRTLWRCLRDCSDDEPEPDYPPTAPSRLSHLHLEWEQPTVTVLCGEPAPWEYGDDVLLPCVLEAGHDGAHLAPPF